MAALSGRLLPRERVHGDGVGALRGPWRLVPGRPAIDEGEAGGGAGLVVVVDVVAAHGRAAGGRALPELEAGDEEPIACDVASAAGDDRCLGAGRGEQQHV